MSTDDIRTLSTKAEKEKERKDGTDGSSVESGSITGAVEEEGDEGMRAWLTLLGSSLVYFATFGIINSFGFFQNYYKDHFLDSVPASTISFVGTIQITLMNLLAAPAGSLFDCYGLKVCNVEHQSNGSSDPHRDCISFPESAAQQLCSGSRSFSPASSGKSSSYRASSSVPQLHSEHSLRWSS